ncbi:uncharacterized protein M6B38_340635 [Iris pallida]|uniref:Uncharacterized protein n=1 Tax=Iris pallida TaxID=29817 RepID=A0AAX6GWV5_IRIPA|nr:uncharacterized protein M6B38_340635 [Iris pallida]
MDPPAKPGLLRRRVLLLGVLILAFRFAYIVSLNDGSCSNTAFCFFSSVPPAGSAGSVSLRRDSSVPAAWRSREWRKAIDYYSSIFQDLVVEGFLSPSEVALFRNNLRPGGPRSKGDRRLRLDRRLERTVPSPRRLRRLHRALPSPVRQRLLRLRLNRKEHRRIEPSVGSRFGIRTRSEDGRLPGRSHRLRRGFLQPGLAPGPLSPLPEGPVKRDQRSRFLRSSP